MLTGSLRLRRTTSLLSRRNRSVRRLAHRVSLLLSVWMLWQRLARKLAW
jgi:hypothetical protein